MKNKILIGNLSTFYSISKQTLIHYDNIGLLKPSVIETNGYRYYTYEDIEKLDLILSLKDTGLSLKEIKNYLNHPSIEESIELLTIQNKLLEERILQLQQTKHKLDYKIDELKYINDLEIYEGIRLVEKEERYIIKENLLNLADLDHEIMVAIKRLNNYIRDHSYYAHYGHSIAGVTINHLKFEANNFYEILNTFIFIDTYKGMEKESILTAGTYLCMIHRGLYSKTYESYSQLLKYAKANNLEIVGDSIEIPLITSWSAKKEEDYITEIQIPVEKKKAKSIY